MRAFRNSNRMLAFVYYPGDGTRLVVPTRIMHKMAAKRSNRGRYAYSDCGRTVTVRDKFSHQTQVWRLAYVEITKL